MGRSAMRASAAAHGTLAALAALGLCACQEADVGQPCMLDVYAGPSLVLIDASVSSSTGDYCSADTGDYFRSGAIECENLICIRSATGATCGDTTAYAAGYTKDIRKYCSKPCIADQDCKNDLIDLVCRPIVLDSCYVSYLQWCANPGSSSNPCPSYPSGSCPADAAALLGSIPSSNYCATRT